MKKNILFIIAILASYLTLKAQTPSWIWATQKGGSFIDVGESIATDANGNILTVGSSNGAYFLEKQDSNGNLLWSKNTGDGCSVTTDASNNIYVVGNFSGSLAIGSNTLTCSGAQDMFIAKYDAAGNALWAKKAGGSGDDYCFSVVVDVNGNVIVSGIFSSASITFDSYNLTNKGIFVVKYDSTGNVIWAKCAGNNNSCLIWDCTVTTNAAGDLYVTGNFGPLIIFGNDTLTSNGANDLFIVKYDTNGNVLWARSDGGTQSDYSCSIAADASGNAYVTGYFWSNSVTFGSTTLTNKGYTDMFIVKYDATGNVLWAKSPIGTGNEDAYSAVTDANGNLYVAGYFNEHLDFDGTSFTTAGGTDIFAVKYDNNGNVIWAKTAGGTDGDNGFGIAVDASSNVYVTGYFKSSPVSFGGITLINTAGWHDVFIAKLGSTVTGVSKNDVDINLFNVYPNPSGSIFTISYQGKSSEVSVFIRNQLGQQIMVKNYGTLDQLNETINLSQFGKGIYFVEFASGESKEVRKIVIE